MDWDKILGELTFRTSRSSGAGGQHVNKTETRVELLWNIKSTQGLSEEELTLATTVLASVITDDGILQMSSQKHRSQLMNKEDVIEKFKTKLEKALIPKTKRKPSKPPKSAVEERLNEKKIISEKKEARRKPEW